MPDQGTHALSSSPRRELQGAAQHAEQASLNTEKASVPHPAEQVQTAAQNLSNWLSALVGSKPKQLPQQEGLGLLQCSHAELDLPHSMQARLWQVEPDSLFPDEACTAPQHTLHPASRAGTVSQEQVRLLPLLNSYVTFKHSERPMQDWPFLRAALAGL